VELGQANIASDNDCTEIDVTAADNAALVGYNREPNHGGVGVFGVSDSKEYGIGVGGCAVGAGVYGISSQGLGVVGRVMGGETVEKEPLESLVPGVGVFGNSIEGAGIRGHGGTGIPSPSPSHERSPRPIGAIFSAGELQERELPGSPAKHEVGIESVAQMQLIPCNVDTLPKTARIGDFFLAIRSDGPAGLFICTRISGATPKWMPVLMGGEVDGGTQF